MYTRILVPLDGSEAAEQVLPYARGLAEKLETPVELVTVIDLSAYFASRKARYLDQLVEDGIRGSRSYLNGVAKTFAFAGVEGVVERGRTEQIIITKAAADKGTLITMATHGRSGINRWLLGSVAEKVLRGAHNPVLLVRAREGGKTHGTAMPDTVIVPLDGSELAESVLPPVVELAKAIGLKVIVQRSYSAKQIIHSYAHERYIPERDELELEWKGVVTRYLDAKVRQLKSEGLADIVAVVSVGEAAEMVIELAKGAPNSLIAMCTHGRSGVTRWLLGSVTERVVRHSDSPVLVYRGQ